MYYISTIGLFLIQFFTFTLILTQTREKVKKEGKYIF